MTQSWKFYSFINMKFQSFLFMWYCFSFYACRWKLNRTDCELVRWKQFQSWTKVKVVKWSQKRWNWSSWMYKYHKQCEIIQENSMKGLKHWLTDRSSLLKMWRKKKLGKLKHELLKILNWCDLSKVGPCERVRPELSEYVWHMVA